MDFNNIYNQVVGSLSSNEFFQGGIILALLTWLGYQLKSIPTFLISKLRYYATYTVHFDDSSEFYRVFAEWLHENYPQKFRNVEVKFTTDWREGDCQPTPSVNEPQDIKLRKLQFSDSNVIFFAGRWLWIQKDRREMNNVKDFRSLFYNNYSISGFFAKHAIDSLCAEILKRKQAEREINNVRLYTHNESYWDGRFLGIAKTFDHLFFEGKKAFIADVKEFLNKKDFYREKGINYKRSYLLYGRGGTGKTSIGVATAQMLKYNLYMLNLGGVRDDSQLQSLSSRIEPRSVILLEDIDCLFEAEREVKNKDLNFSTLLNFLDGLYAPTDCIIIMTTNKPEILDAALIRKGRVDVSLHVDYPKQNEVESFMSDFYETDVVLPLLNFNKPMSELQDICLRNPKLEEAIAELEAKTIAA